MYKVIVVDDEIIIRNGLRNFISYSDMGFEVVNTFADGKQAIEYIKENHVDVIITDVKMDIISGVELAKYVYENKPSIKVLILSGYKEFKYAQEAIKYNVEYYLSKPTKLEEIKSAFENIRKILDEETEKEKEIMQAKERYFELIPYLQKQFFLDIMLGTLQSKQEIEKRAQMINLDYKELLDSLCCVVKITFENFDNYMKDKYSYGKEEFNITLQNLINIQNEGKYNLQLFFDNNKIKALVLSSKYSDISTFQHELNKLFINLEKSAKEMLNLEIKPSIEYCCENLFELPNYNLISNDNESLGGINSIEENCKMLVSHITSGCFDEAGNLLNNLIKERENTSPENLYLFFTDLFSRLFVNLSANGIDVSEIRAKEFDINIIFRMKEKKEIIDWSKTLLQDIIDDVNPNKETSQMLIINKAKEYINNNFYKDISLEDVADYVYLHPVYFSKYFKQYTGENFVDYLLKLRMQYAIELLKENKYKVYEISEKIGYKSCKYFNKIFKKYTNYTPKEYCRGNMEVGVFSDEE